MPRQALAFDPRRSWLGIETFKGKLTWISPISGNSSGAGLWNNQPHRFGHSYDSRSSLPTEALLSHPGRGSLALRTPSPDNYTCMQHKQPL